MRVFANGESRLFGESVLDSIVALCESWRMEGEELFQCMALPDTAAMLDYLLEAGGIYVE